VFGVQFHPESIATEGGHALLANFLDLAGVKRWAAA
jgi:anthranilate synthase component 2